MARSVARSNSDKSVIVDTRRGKLRQSPTRRSSGKTSGKCVRGNAVRHTVVCLEVDGGRFETPTVTTRLSDFCI
jgi:hypothetical protein